MKQITESKLVEYTTVRFFADDGTEFKTEEQCRRYEKSLYQEQFKKLFDGVEHKLIDLPLVDWGCEADGYIVRMNSESDYRTTCDYFDSIMPNCEVDITEPAHYPCTKIIIAKWEDNAVCEYCNTVDSLVNRYQKTIEEITNF